MLRQLPDSVSVIKLESFPERTDPLIWLSVFLAHGRKRPFQRPYLAVLGTTAFPDWQSSMAFHLVRASSLLLPVSRGLWQKMAERCPTLRQRPWSVLRPPLDVETGNLNSPVSIPGWEGCDRPVVVTVSRLTADKQASQCLKIHHRLKEEGVQFRWYWVGSGPEEARLRSEIEMLGMADNFGEI
jgi:glycosyltransferase involved in cell wall biosynthesis